MSSGLNAEQLRTTIDPDTFGFETTDELPKLAKPLGQERALSAIKFGLDIKCHGYNLFVLGEPGAGKRSTVTAVLEEKAAGAAAPDDWMYLYNFADEERPMAVRLPAGEGEKFKAAIEKLVAAVIADVPKAFGEESYARDKAELLREGQERRNAAFEELEKLAKSHSFLLQRTPEGITMLYAHGDEPLDPDEFPNLPEEEQERIKDSREVLQNSLHDTIIEVRRIDRDTREKVEALDHRVGLAAVGHEIEEVRSVYSGHESITGFLEAMKADILANLEKFRASEEDKPKLPFPIPFDTGVDEVVKRYTVNLLVNNKDSSAAPVVFESNPSYHNLIGRIEHRAQYGAFLTDYTMIKAGAFHRANGGYLVLDAREVMLSPFAYEALKRVLKDQEIRMEEVGEQFRMIATVTLKPEPIPTDIKVVLLGTPWLYHLLQMYDEDFLKLFKVKGEFASETALTDESRMSYAYLIANQCSNEGLLPFGRDAVARVVEHGLRLSGHQGRLSTRFLEITDLAREANHWAGADSAASVSAEHVERALDHAVYRSDYIEEKLAEMIEDGSILIDTTGSEVGQINGLSVYDLGDYSFGKPSRVTARVFMGKEGLTNIERESDLGGPIHNKGVLILQGFFGARYAQRIPVSFAATICFEQSYGGVEGDSASSAELFALISAITEVPLRQDIAVTGSVNQLGAIQAIGGVNLKIEGFFKTCKARGLTGTQGVIIPASNVQNLMLDKEVVQAVKEGVFHVYPIAHVDEGIEILTGIEAGKADKYNNYPRGSVNSKVIHRLDRIADQWRKLHED